MKICLLCLVMCLTSISCEGSRRQAEQARRDEQDCPRQTENELFLRGERLYQRTCSTCHKMTGDGQQAAFPPLRRHAGKLAASPEGRAYMIRLLLWGQRGPLVAEGVSYNNIMPAQAVGFADDDIVAVLSYVAYTFGNCRQTTQQEAFGAADVASARRETAAEGRAKMKILRVKALGSSKSS